MGSGNEVAALLRRSTGIPARPRSLCPHVDLQTGRAIERCIEDLLSREAVIDLRLRDLHRELDDLAEQDQRAGG